MRPNLYKNRQKSLRKMYDEYMDLVQNRRGVTIPIEPYQKGWYREFAIKDEIWLRPDYLLIAEALKMVNDRQYSSNVDFTYRAGKGRYVEMPFRTKHIHIWKEDQIPEKLTKYFRVNEFLSWNKTKYKAYEFAHPNWLKIDIHPNIITHQFIPDGEAESRIRYLRDKIFREDQYGKLIKEMGWTTGDDWEDRRQKLLNALGDEFPDDA